MPRKGRSQFRAGRASASITSYNAGDDLQLLSEDKEDASRFSDSRNAPAGKFDRGREKMFIVNRDRIITTTKAQHPRLAAG